jgi:hypothetical protein
MQMGLFKKIMELQAVVNVVFLLLFLAENFESYEIDINETDEMVDEDKDTGEKLNAVGN